MVLDLHRFKEVNDTLGHDRGDELLQQVGSRLQGALRAADMVARLGGDEFGILIAGLDSEPEAEEVARKLTGALDASFELAELEIALGGSIGIARYPEDGAEPETLLRHAEVAMYVAKAARGPVPGVCGRAGHLLHRPPRAGRELRRAIDEGELSLVFQPKVDLERSAVVGMRRRSLVGSTRSAAPSSPTALSRSRSIAG